MLAGCGYGDASSDSAEPTTLAEAREITLGHQLEIAANWSGRADWRIDRSTSSKGFPKVTLTHEDGSSFLAGFYASGAEFWVDSYSPCFHHPAGYEYGERY
ncbi:hypothetical protein [Salinibacterium sp. ZJ70]|uniref:hypothetical protein n=1 Tax=Salinibacterium sp. ZJ70 TaxID=2708084 RepID=UPI0014238073|nr:hypothetical protein [Salinibacterium sp. ZJ70]